MWVEGHGLTYQVLGKNNKSHKKKINLRKLHANSDKFPWAKTEVRNFGELEKFHKKIFWLSIFAWQQLTSGNWGQKYWGNNCFISMKYIQLLGVKLNVFYFQIKVSEITVSKNFSPSGIVRFLLVLKTNLQ